MITDGLHISDDNIRSFLMIGQSNMAGRGEFGEVDDIVNDSCFMLRMGRWQRMSEPINTDRAVINGGCRSGVGLAASFADEAAKQLNAKIGLIPCADGGTKIEQWMPGEVLFDHAVMMTRLAMRSSVFSGILWHQGESDCRTDEDLYSHKQKFITMITALRHELGNESIPVIIGELSENITCSWNVGERPKIMNSHYREIANELPCIGVASSKGLTMKSDRLHFDSAAYRIFGRRYFEVYSQLI